jgi:hypothetical protein
MTKDEALKLALDALEGVVYAEHNVQPAITAIKAALAQPEQEPAFYGFLCEEECCVYICYSPCGPGGPNNELPTAYYTSPPQRKPEQEPMHPEIKKMYEDFFDKCFRESFVIKAALAAPPKKWTSLTNEDRRIIDNNYICQLGSVEHFKAVEEKLKELNQ